MALKLIRPELRGVWLVLLLCPDCDFNRQHYCALHDMNKPPGWGNRKGAPRRLR